MRKEFNKVYQFKITLKGIRPAIWRRIQVPETYTFWDLHVAIQDAMDWEDYHLHEFKMRHPTTGETVRLGIPDKGVGFFGQRIIPEREQRIADWFSAENRVADYIYDFGDSWEHELRLEEILPRDEDGEYPVCIAGEMACPPEDCGGIWGYREFLKAIKDPNHERHEELLEWIGGGFDPEHFDVNEVSFDDPDERWEFAFG